MRATLLLWSSLTGLMIGWLCLTMSASLAKASVEDELDAARSDVEKKHYAQAIDRLRDLREGVSGSDRAAVNNALGWTYYLMGDEKAAQGYLLEAYRAEDLGEDTLLKNKITNNLGILFFAKGLLKESRKYFEESAARGSGVAKKYLMLIEGQQRLSEVNQYIRGGVYLRQSTQFENAIEEYSKALSLAPDDARALEFRGYAFFRLGKLKPAEADLRRAYQLNPDRVTVIINLMKVYCSNDDAASLEKLSEDAAKMITEKRVVFESDGELQRVCGDRLLSMLP